MELLGSPQRAYPSIHVAGTNGKTSVARIIDALLTALHRRTGRTTSPHLQSAVERISIDGKPITPGPLRRDLPRDRTVRRTRRPAVRGGRWAGPRMSKFEVVTAMAFAAFADAPVDVAVIEVGLGGRWDATNVVDAPVAVITPIGIDHTEYLGDTIAEIAAEKAGIIVKRPDDPDGPEVDLSTVAIIGQQAPEAMEVVLAEAVRADAAVAREGSEFAVLAPPGRHRRAAARTAGTRRRLPRGVPAAARRAPGPQRRWSRSPRSRRSSGRARTANSTSTPSARVSPTPPAPVDWSGCAAPQRCSSMRRTTRRVRRRSPQALADEFDFRYLVGVVSVMGDKDVDGILAALEPAFDQIVVTHNGSPRALDVEGLAMRAEEQFGPDRVDHGADAARRHRDRDRTGRGQRERRRPGSPAAASSSPGRSSPRVRPAPCSDGIPS